MKMRKYSIYTFVITSCLFVFANGRTSGIENGSRTGENQKLNTEEIIEKYSLCSRKFDNISYDLETTLEFGDEKHEKQVHLLQYCSKNTQKQWIGNSKRFNEDGSIDQRSSTLVKVILNEKEGVCLNFYNPELESKRLPEAMLISSNLDNSLQVYSEHLPFGGSLSGRFCGNNGQSVYDLLKDASNLKFNNNITKIMDHDVCFFEAETKYGTVKAWISLELDYNCLKWEIEKTPNQYYRDGMPSNDSYTKSIAVYEAEKLEQINGRYMVTHAKLNYKVIKDNETLSDSTFHFSISNIDLSPDYEALRAFEIQLPEGTIVRNENFEVIYQWIDGKSVKADKQKLARKTIEIVDPSVKSEPIEPLNEQEILPVSRNNIVKHIEQLTTLESRHITHLGNKKASAYIINELKKYGYTPVTDSFEAENTKLFNVASDSSDKKKPVILISAHFDSKSSVSSQAPGADDNASGVAALLELAMILKEKGIQKNLEFVFFNCEENGKLGSKHLSDKYRDNQWPIDYMINIDTIGTWRGSLSKTCPVNYVTDENSKGIVEQFEEKFPYPIQESKIMWTDDQENFWNNGFKAISITEDGYTRHMHKPTDTAEKLDYDNIARIVHGLYIVLIQ